MDPVHTLARSLGVASRTEDPSQAFPHDGLPLLNYLAEVTLSNYHALLPVSVPEVIVRVPAPVFVLVYVPDVEPALK